LPDCGGQLGGLAEVGIAANSTTNRVYTAGIGGGSILEMQDGNSPKVWITVAPAAPNGQSGWYTLPADEPPHGRPCLSSRLDGNYHGMWMDRCTLVTYG
jgi:hypothetical protein